MSLDVLIVGAGPAGVSAALWAREFGLEVLLLEGGSAPGGQLQHVHFAPRDLAGVRVGDGRAIAKVYAAQLLDAGVAIRLDCAVSGLRGTCEQSSTPELRLSTGERLVAETMLICTGARRRRLEVPGERELQGRGVSYSATLDRERFAGLPMVVVGGGDAAYENALILAEADCEVTLVVRGVSRARPQFAARVSRHPRIAVQAEQRVTRVLGDTQVRALRVADKQGERELPCAGVVIKVGVMPNSEWCQDALAHDSQGYLRVDARHATSDARIWAAGDVARPLLPSIPVAMSQGAQAIAVIREALQGR